MPKYIDAHRAENLLRMCGTYHGVISFDTVIDVLHDTQTVDVVEVVRCKDCKHWGIHKWLNIPWCREMHIDRGAEDFCSIAERREDGNN